MGGPGVGAGGARAAGERFRAAARAGGEHLDHYRDIASGEAHFAATMIEPQREKPGVETLAATAAGMGQDELERRYEAQVDAVSLSGVAP